MNRRKFLQVLAAIGVAPVAVPVVPKAEELEPRAITVDDARRLYDSMTERPKEAIDKRVVEFSYGDDPDTGWFRADPVTGQLRRIGDDGWRLVVDGRIQDA